MKSRISCTKKELVTIILCAGFLFAALGAVGSGGRRRAKEAICADNLKRWGLILFAFANDNAGYFADRFLMCRWTDTLWSYYREEPKLLLCPEATKSYAEGAVNPHVASPLDWTPGDPRHRYSYGVNLWISNRPGIQSQGRVAGTYWRTPYRAGVADCPMLIDSQCSNIQPYPFDNPPEYEQAPWTAGPENEMRRPCINRHNGVNAVFLDGSVRKVGLKHLWRLRWFPGWNDFDQWNFAQGGYWPPWMDNFKEPQ